MAAACGLRRGSHFLVVLPLFHVNAQFYALSASISVGGTVTLTAGFSASRFLQQAERFRASHASLFAAPIRMILARAEPVPISQPLDMCGSRRTSPTMSMSGSPGWWDAVRDRAIA
jgi:carnitine-CoA ligase